MMTDIKNAATIVLIRKKGSKYFLLLGKRVPTVAFMPSKYVFPGGSWEILDNDVPVIKRINIRDRLLLSMETEFAESANLGVTAIRELWEETGLRLSSNGQCNNFPLSWKEFFLDNQAPDLSNLKFFFRAVTPPGRSRRFDARFFFCNASHIFNSLDDFSKASGELNFLKWIEISQADHFDLPNITKIVIRYLMTIIESDFKYDSVPFFSGGANGLKEKKLKL